MGIQGWALVAERQIGCCAPTGFDVNKVGDARVGLVGFPSVGKSTLLTKLTGTMSEVSTHRDMTAALCICQLPCVGITLYNATPRRCSVPYPT